jgi:hypothetical protein
MATVTAALAVLSLPTRAADAAKDAEKDKIRQKYEAIIQFYGEEDTGRYSLRILDENAKETANFEFRSFWKYDVEQKAWIKLDGNPQRTRIVLPKEKPADAPADSQVLATLPVTQKDVGLFFIKWTVNGVDGVTYTRIGPRARGEQPALKAGKDQTVADIPIDLNKAVRMVIPDPYVALKDK